MEVAELCLAGTVEPADLSVLSHTRVQQKPRGQSGQHTDGGDGPQIKYNKAVETAYGNCPRLAPRFLLGRFQKLLSTKLMFPIISDTVCTQQITSKLTKVIHSCLNIARKPGLYSTVRPSASFKCSSKKYCFNAKK